MLKSRSTRTLAVLVGTLAASSAFALDTTAAIASISAAQTDVEAVAVAIIGVAAVMFGISKIRQLIKA
jgi:hypothetical protein